MLVLSKVDQFVRKYDVPCDFNLTTTFDVCLTPEFAKLEADAFVAYNKSGGDVSHVKLYDREAALRKTRVKGVISAYEWPAGSSHPAKLAQWLLTRCIERGVNLFTHCRVSQVTRATDGKCWDVTTPRGIITVESVIHCTNAYASLLLPQLQPCLKSNRVQAQSLIAPPSLNGDHSLTTTFSLRYSLEHFYSLIQRKDDGTLIWGQSPTKPVLSAQTLAGLVTYDDTGYDIETAHDATRELHKLFLREGEQAEADQTWTGIVGMTGDSVPFVGPVEGLDGQWICAGFGAHGKFSSFALWQNTDRAFRYGENLYLCSRSGEVGGRRVMERDWTS